MFKYLHHRYWTWPRISFTVFYSLLMAAFLYSGYKTFTIPKEKMSVTVLNKTTGFRSNGTPRYFIEVQSNEKIWTEEIDFKYRYDSLNIHNEIILDVFQKKSYIFCGLMLLSFCGLIIYGSPFAKLVLKLKDEVL